MLTLGDRATGRDNNFNLIRMVAAIGVLVSHAWPLALGPGTVEPLKELTGRSMGTLSVYVFFVVSGFLIAASYERARTRTRFVVARVLRILPGLFVSLLLVAFVMGPVLTTLPVSAYLPDPRVWTFLWNNTTLFSAQYTLPGVFETNPYPAVEGSIWTLIHEVTAYAGLFLLGVTGLLARRGAMAALLLVFIAAWYAVPALDLGLPRKILQFRELSLPFAIGTAFYLWRYRLPLSLPLAAVLILLAWLGSATPLYPLALIVALGYGVFWLAYVPGGFLRAYNRLGDYSYGVYIYAFPVQGLAVWIAGPMSPGENILWALPLTLLPAILSWHLIEKPALDVRRWLVAWLHPEMHRPAQVQSDRRVQ